VEFWGWLISLFSLFDGVYDLTMYTWGEKCIDMFYDEMEHNFPNL
jgi:hypothetical protein